jgi:ankyrin repeat protein
MLGQQGPAAAGIMMAQPQMPFGNATMDASGSAMGTGQPLRTPGSAVSFDVGSSSMGHLQQAQGVRHPAYEQPGPESMMYGAGVQMSQPGAASYYPMPSTSYQPTTIIQGYSTPAAQPTGSRGQLKRPLDGETGQLDQVNGGQAGAGAGPGLYVDQYGRSFMVESDGGAQPPLKRVRQETYGAGFGEADGSAGAQAVVEDESRTIPVGTRLAVRPSRPRHLDAIGSPGGNVGDVASLAMSEHRARTKLLAIFEAKETTEVDLNVLLAPSPSKPKREAERRRADDDEEDEDEEHDALVMDDEDEDDDKDVEIDIDQVIDDRGHTVLHWAAALARDGIIAQLIKRGADVHRGNFSGETPLIRAILTTNNADRNTLSILLDRYLGASVRTIDNSHRSVLHHVALVAGIKGRATSANYYMSTLLEWIARHAEDSGIKSFVNAKDMQGDTALNVAARVGDKNLVKLLLDAGADPSRANKIGLRPVDYGLEVPVS